MEVMKFRQVGPYICMLIAFTGWFTAQAQDCTDSSFCTDLKDYCSDTRVQGWCPKLCEKCVATTTTATTTTGPPCTDEIEQCPSWKSYCENSEWMAENCKKTCNLCGARGWSECTKTCGGGTRHREKCNEGKCEIVFESCASPECSDAVCSSTKERRFGIPHECCKKVGVSECGQSFVISRVLGGENAKSKQWPWMVAISTTTGEFCAGVLISTKFILSVAHCFVDGLGKQHNTANWKIHTGLLRLSGAKSGRAIKNVTVHPDYKFPANDIVIVELVKPLKFSAAKQPICLPGGEVTPLDTTCYVTGWGISDHSGSGTTNHLQEAGLKNLDRRICQKAYKGIDQLKHVVQFLNENTGYLCAGSLTERLDSCLGDSGGPLVCQRCSSCIWYLAGLVSFGSLNCSTIGVPGVYTEVREHEAWISQVTQISHPIRTCPGTNGA